MTGRSRIRGPRSPRCCRTRGRPWPLTATAWPGSPPISASAAACRPPGNGAGTCSRPGCRPLARSILTRWVPGLGPEHPDARAARADLASCTGETGDQAAARDQYAALLPALERGLGPDHPDTLTARAGLARWTGETGDPASARDQYAALLPA